MGKNRGNFTPEVRARAVRMVKEHRDDFPSETAAILVIASKIGCTGESLRGWIRKAERENGERSERPTDERERIRQLERENHELRQANEILRKASAFFAKAELDRLSKP